MGLLATLVQGQLGSAYSQIAWAAWMTREAGLAEKNRNSTSSLAGGLFFLRPSRPAIASKLLFICAHPWSKCFWVIGSYRQPLQCFRGKIFRNLLEA